MLGSFQRVGTLLSRQKSVSLRQPCAPSVNSACSLYRAGIMQFSRSNTPLRSPFPVRSAIFRGFAQSHVSHLSRHPYALPGVRRTLTSGQKLALTGAVTVGVIGIGSIYAYGQSDYAAVNEEVVAEGRLAPFVRDRLQATYGYVVGGLGVTGLAAAGAIRSGMAFRVANLNPWAGFFLFLASTLGSSILTMSLDQHKHPVAKHAAWATSMAAFGAMLSPLGYVGSPLVLQAAMATGVVVGSISAVAAAAPSDAFLWMGGPASIGLGILVAASIGSMAFPASRALNTAALYGGLGLFGALTLYDTQQVINRAKVMPEKAYDPINESFAIYLNFINKFLRLVQIASNDRARR